MSTHIIRDYEGDRPLYEPAVYIHLFRASRTTQRKTSLFQRLSAFVRRQVTTTRNK